MSPLKVPADADFEREKWLAECLFRERELSVKEQDSELAKAEHSLKESEHASEHWKSPIIVAILAAAIAGAGNAAVSYINANAQTKLEAQKSEQARILEMIKTGNADKAAENLLFLLDASLIKDAELRTELRAFLSKRKPGVGPSLPPASFIPRDAQDVLSRFEGAALKPYKDPTGNLVLGTGHRLTSAEQSSGTVRIAGQDIPYESGLTGAQSQQLLEQDLQPIRAVVGKLVTVPLTTQQSEALVSLVYHVGITNFKGSVLLRKLNEGNYEEVPEQMKRWAMVNGKVLPGLAARRDAEAALWRKP